MAPARWGASCVERARGGPLHAGTAYGLNWGCEEDARAVLDWLADAVRGAIWLADVVRFTCCEIAEVEGTVEPGGVASASLREAPLANLGAPLVTAPSWPVDRRYEPGAPVAHLDKGEADER